MSKVVDITDRIIKQQTDYLGEAPCLTVNVDVFNHTDDHEPAKSQGMDIIPINTGIAFLIGDLSASVTTEDARTLAYQILQWIEVRNG